MNISGANISKQDLVKLYRQALLAGQPLEELDQRLDKKVSRLKVAAKVEASDDEAKLSSLKKAVPKAVRFGSLLMPIIFIVIGFMLLGSAVVPILGFYAKNFTAQAQPKLKAPIPQESVLDVTPLVVSRIESDSDAGQKIERMASGPVMVDAELDYTNLANWFDDEAWQQLETQTSLLSKQTGEYIVDIPSLNVKNAAVKIGGVNLDDSLIQYPGTSLPGKPGAPVVFGHSVLRQFYNPKETNSRRYNSIFSTIMTLEPGERFYVTYAGVKYTYMVKSKTEVKPEDTYILSQDYSQRQFKLVTCVPEGTYLRRGVVTAQLVKE